MELKKISKLLNESAANKTYKAQKDAMFKNNPLLKSCI